MKKLLSVLALLVLVLALPVSAETTKVGIKVDSAGAEQVSAGTGTGLLTLGGVLCKGTGAATTGTSEEVLATCTIPAATLATAGASIRVSFLAHTAANANNKTMKVRVGGIGGVVAYTTVAAGANNQDFLPNAGILVTRTGATTATSYGYVTYVADKSSGGAAGGGTYADRALSVTWANANDLVITALTPTAAGDFTLDSYLVEVVQ